MSNRKLAFILLLAGPLAGSVQAARAQSPVSLTELRAQQARNSLGVRAGTWDVPAPTKTDISYKSTITIDAFVQRGLAEHLALESSASIWRRTSTRVQPAGNPVVTRSYLVPLQSAVKWYPLTRAARRLQPFVSAGIGFALGIQRESTNAIGGGGTDVVTGFGVEASTGAEYHVTGRFALVAVARYQALKLSDNISDQQEFSGRGVEAGLSYRFRGP